MKTSINAILIVEGKTDISFLSTFLDCQFIETNGSEISKETLEAIKTLSKNNEIIVLTDPDSPGKRIRDIISKEIPEAKHAFVRKEFSIKKNKVGVAESTKEEVLRALSEVKTLNKNTKFNTYTLKFFIENNYLLVNSKDFRKFAGDYFGFDFVNLKRFIQRLNQINISSEDFNQCYQEYNRLHGNESN